ncbi:MAG: hypothetical protein OEW36_11110, partial [Hylemonella sp.]|nr:hypothetical protein [Hylemonella sp.]
ACASAQSVNTGIEMETRFVGSGGHNDAQVSRTIGGAGVFAFEAAHRYVGITPISRWIQAIARSSMKSSRKAMPIIAPIPSAVTGGVLKANIRGIWLESKWQCGARGQIPSPAIVVRGCTTK